MAMLKRQSILSFVFVRHPLDRLESAYYDKIVGKPSDTFYKMVKNIKAKCKILQMFSPLSFKSTVMRKSAKEFNISGWLFSSLIAKSKVPIHTSYLPH